MISFDVTEDCGIVISSRNYNEIGSVPCRRELCGDGSNIVIVGCTNF